MIQIYLINSPKVTDKIAGFDYDWTLVHPKAGKIFPKDVNDWVWMFENIPEILKDYYDKGYTIAIFTNQSKVWKLEQLQKSLKTLQIPLFIVVSYALSKEDKKYYKPNILMFKELIKGEYNKKLSFFVGDALGRPSDFSDSDKVFAENLGIPYISPENFFYRDKSFTVPNIPILPEKELIIMVGYPGSGKSTIATKICESNNCIYISGDIYKTLPKIKQQIKHYSSTNKSILIDATNSSAKKRLEYISLVKEYEYKIRCIHVSTSREESFKRNKLRDDKKQVPQIAYSVYDKYYDEPNENEGFTLLTI